MIHTLFITIAAAATSATPTPRATLSPREAFERQPNINNLLVYAGMLPPAAVDERGTVSKAPPKDATLEAFKAKLAKPLRLGGELSGEAPLNSVDWTGPRGPALPKAKPSLFKNAEDVFALPAGPYAKRTTAKAQKKRRINYRTMNDGTARALAVWAQTATKSATSATFGPMINNAHAGLTGVYDIGSVAIAFETPLPAFALGEKSVGHAAVLAASQALGEPNCTDETYGWYHFGLDAPRKDQVVGVLLTTAKVDPAKAKVTVTGKLGKDGFGVRLWTYDLDADGADDVVVRSEAAPGQVSEPVVLEIQTIVNINGQWRIGRAVANHDCT